MCLLIESSRQQSLNKIADMSVFDDPGADAKWSTIYLKNQ